MWPVLVTVHVHWRRMPSSQSVLPGGGLSAPQWGRAGDGTSSVPLWILLALVLTTAERRVVGATCRWGWISLSRPVRFRATHSAARGWRPDAHLWAGHPLGEPTPSRPPLRRHSRPPSSVVLLLLLKSVESRQLLWFIVACDQPGVLTLTPETYRSLFRRGLLHTWNGAFKIQSGRLYLLTGVLRRLAFMWSLAIGLKLECTGRLFWGFFYSFFPSFGEWSIFGDSVVCPLDLPPSHL